MAYWVLGIPVREGGTVGDWEWRAGSNRTGGCGIRRQSREGWTAGGAFTGWLVRLNGEWVPRPLPPGTVEDYRCKQDGWHKYVRGAGETGELVPTTLAAVIRDLPEMREIILHLHVSRLRMNRIALERLTMQSQRLREDLRSVL